MSDVWYCINESDTGDWPTSIWDGLGIPASQIPSTGTSGAAYLYNDIAAQGASATDEFYSNVLTTPASGTFTHNEYSAFSLVGAADGTHLATYEGYLNGVKYGDYTITMEIGSNESNTSIAGDLPKLTSSMTVAITAAGYNINIAGSLPKPSSSISMASVVPSYNMNVAGSLPKVNSTMSITVGNNSVNINLAGNLPKITSSMSITRTAPSYNIDITSTLPKLNSSLILNSEGLTYHIPKSNMIYLDFSSNYNNI